MWIVFFYHFHHLLSTFEMLQTIQISFMTYPLQLVVSLVFSYHTKTCNAVIDKICENNYEHNEDEDWTEDQKKIFMKVELFLGVNYNFLVCKIWRHNFRTIVHVFNWGIFVIFTYYLRNRCLHRLQYIPKKL